MRLTFGSYRVVSQPGARPESPLALRFPVGCHTNGVLVPLEELKQCTERVLACNRSRIFARSQKTLRMPSMDVFRLRLTKCA